MAEKAPSPQTEWCSHSRLLHSWLHRLCLYSSSNSGACGFTPRAPEPTGAHREGGGLKLGNPGFVGCSGSTSLPAGHDHAVIGALAMNSAEKGESASENSQLSSHFSTKELKRSCVRSLMHRCRQLHSVRKQEWQGLGYCWDMHTHTGLLPPSPLGYTPKLSVAQNPLSPIEALYWLHTGLTFHFLC